MGERFTVYWFRDGHFAVAGDTIVSAAPLDVVVSVYGGGGLKGEAGLAAAFGGAAYYRSDETGFCYLGVWGARNASRFRRALRQSEFPVDVVREAPPARLTWWQVDAKTKVALIESEP